MAKALPVVISNHNNTYVTDDIHIYTKPLLKKLYRDYVFTHTTYVFRVGYTIPSADIYVWLRALDHIQCLG